MRNVWLALLLMLLFSCREDVVWNPKPTDKQLIVDGSVTTDSINHVISLSKSFGIFDKKLERVSEASVYVEGNGVRYLYKESDEQDEKGKYVSLLAFKGEPGVTYDLNIDLSEPINGHDNFTAQTMIQEGLVVDSIEVLFYLGEDQFGSQDHLFDVKIFGQEPAVKGNSYEHKIFINDTPLGSGVLSRQNVFDDQFINNQYVDMVIESRSTREFTLLKYDTIFIDESPLLIERPLYDTLMVELSTLSFGYGEYLIGIFDQLERLEDFLGLSGPAANVEGNISNGAKGYFYSANISSQYLLSGSDREKFDYELP